MKEYLKEKEGIDINIKYDQDKIVERWERLGFLDNLTIRNLDLDEIPVNDAEIDTIKTKIANEFETMAVKLIKDEIEYFKFVETGVFPIIRRVLTYEKVYNKEIENFTDMVIDTLLENYSLYKELKSISRINNIDFEAEFCCKICEIIAEKITVG